MKYGGGMNELPYPSDLTAAGKRNGDVIHNTVHHKPELHAAPPLAPICNRSLLECGGCECRSAPSLYCWYVWIGSLIHLVIAPSSRSIPKLQHCRLDYQRNFRYERSHCTSSGLDVSGAERVRLKLSA